MVANVRLLYVSTQLFNTVLVSYSESEDELKVESYKKRANNKTADIVALAKNQHPVSPRTQVTHSANLELEEGGGWFVGVKTRDKPTSS